MAIMEFDDLLERQRAHECPGVGSQRICVRVVATAQLPTRFGNYQVVGFENRLERPSTYAAFVFSHSALNGEAIVGADPLGMPDRGRHHFTLVCDCRDQLEASFLAFLSYAVLDDPVPAGRSRVIGLTNMIQAYKLQDHGLDTVEANIGLGLQGTTSAITRSLFTSASSLGVPVVAFDDEQPAEDRQHLWRLDGGPRRYDAVDVPRSTRKSGMCRG